MRVFCKRYQPEDLPMQPGARVGVFHKFLIATPFLLVASLGFKAQHGADRFFFVACNSKQNADISAYESVVKGSQILHGVSRNPDKKVARTMAYRWLEGAKVGLLKPLQPVAYEDTSRDGVKSEIVNANINVSEALNMVADNERLDHQWDQSAKDAMLGATALEVSKFFDFSSLSVCSMVQRRSLNVVAGEWKKLSPGVRLQVGREALALRANDDKLRQMALRARDELLQYELRRGCDYRRVATIQRDIDMKQFREPLPMVVKNLKHEVFQSKDPLSPNFYTELRLGYLSALDTDRKIDDLVKRSNPVL